MAGEVVQGSSLPPCPRGPTGPQARATTKDQRSDGRSEAKIADSRARATKGSFRGFYLRG
nr:MAG TPA: hypothetical protein [Caudoviricetes sp.]